MGGTQGTQAQGHQCRWGCGGGMNIPHLMSIFFKNNCQCQNSLKDQAVPP
jgi:hypothetical protein